MFHSPMLSSFYSRLPSSPGSKEQSDDIKRHRCFACLNLGLRGPGECVRDPTPAAAVEFPSIKMTISTPGMLDIGMIEAAFLSLIR